MVIIDGGISGICLSNLFVFTLRLRESTDHEPDYNERWGQGRCLVRGRVINGLQTPPPSSTISWSFIQLYLGQVQSVLVLSSPVIQAASENPVPVL